MHCVASNSLHTSISFSPLISYPSYFNSFRMPRDIKRLQVWWSPVFLGSVLNQLFEISNEFFLLERIGTPDVQGLVLRADVGGGGVAKLKLCHTMRVRKGVECFRCYWSQTGRESWIVLGCRLCYFTLPWRRNFRGMLFTCSFSLKLIESTPDIAHYRKKV